jgi:hypothetical protein
VRLIAAAATRLHPPTSRDLGRVIRNPADWIGAAGFPLMGRDW